MSGKRVTGPVFLTSTLTAVVYRTIIEEYVALLEVSEHRLWFQEDNARPHVAKDIMDFLHEFFGGGLLASV